MIETTSEVVHILDGQRSIRRFFFFFGCSWGAWGSTPHINCFVAAWHASWPHVLLWLAEGSHFRWNLFRFPALFKVDLLNPCLSLLISSFSFHVWFFWLYNCFYAFCSLSYQFLSLFLGTPLIYAFFLSEFYCIPFFCAYISFSSCVTFLSGGLLWNLTHFSLHRLPFYLLRSTDRFF